MASTRALWPLTLPVALAGCMFFRSLDDLTAGATDAGSDAPPAAFEAGTDVASVDAGPAPSPCAATAHTLCADFDEGEIDASFESLDLGAGGTVSITDARAVSGARSLVSTCERRAGTGHDSIGARVEHGVVGPYTHARLAFDVYVETPSSQTDDKGLGLATVLFRSGSAQAGTILWRSPGETYLSTETLPQEYFDVPALAFDRWVHVILDYRVGGTYEFVVDGVKGSRPAAPAALDGSTQVTLGIGLISFDAPTPAMRVYYDNVVYDVD